MKLDIAHLYVLCVALMFGLLWTGDATPGAFALIGLGAAVMAAVCVIAEF